MLILLNRPNVISIFNKAKEGNKKTTQNSIIDQNLNNDFRRKHPIKAKTEEMLNKHEEALLQKKDIINKNLKSQTDAIKFRLESRKFSKTHIKNTTISKKNSLFLGISTFFLLFSFFSNVIDMDLINEASSHSNLSTKSEEISNNF